MSARRAGGNPRARRLRAPLLVALWILFALESVGGLVIFFGRLAWGATPGEALHVVGGLALTLAYAIYQVQHWRRVSPVRARLDYALGLIAAGAMIAVNGLGLALGVIWWRARIVEASAAPIRYPPLLSATHNIASLLAITFALAHLGAVLARDRTSASPET